MYSPMDAVAPAWLREAADPQKLASAEIRAVVLGSRFRVQSLGFRV